MVWNKNKGRPRVRHATLEIAVGEAERLSAKDPLCTFVVFEAIQEIGPKIERPSESDKPPKETNHPKKCKTEPKSPLTLAQIRQEKQKQS